MPICNKERVIGVQFGVFSPEEIKRRSVVEITNPGTHEGNEPKIGGLFDPRMGVLDNNRICPTDGKNSRDCPGHWGHLNLTRPVQNIQFMANLLKVLRCVCPKCGKLLVDRNDPAQMGIMEMARKPRAAAIFKECAKIKHCGDATLDGCGAKVPNKVENQGLATIVATWITSVEGEDGKKEKDELRSEQTVEQVLTILQRISDEDCEALGQSKEWGRPDWMICQVLPIAPPSLRPSIKQENNQRSEDDVTQKYIEIIRINDELRKKIAEKASPKAIHEAHLMLQQHVATLANNAIPGVASSAHRLGRPLRAISQRLGGKDGRIRANLMGKRVDQSARSVITGDPNISVEELGVPLKIAMNITFPEVVNRDNIERLQAMVNAGPDVYPGAKTVWRREENATQSLRIQARRAMPVDIGDVVHRHLIDGDIVLFNRQPSLHRPSMMAHRVVVLPQNSFRINITVTPPQNADCDKRLCRKQEA